MEQKESDNIELRSEKVRNVIGKVPPRLVSLGTVIITVIVIALGMAFYKIPYPISVEVNGEVVSDSAVQVYVPYKYLYLFNDSRTANISFEGYEETTYQCKLTSHNTKLIHREDGNYFVATGMVRLSGKGSAMSQKHQKANVRIIVSDKTLWQQVFG